MKHKFKLKIYQNEYDRFQVLLDNLDISDITTDLSIVLSATDNFPMVTLKLIPEELDFEGKLKNLKTLKLLEAIEAIDE